MGLHCPLTPMIVENITNFLSFLPHLQLWKTNEAAGSRNKQATSKKVTLNESRKTFKKTACKTTLLYRISCNCRGFGFVFASYFL